MKISQRRADDVLRRDDETAVLVDRAVVRLSQISSVIYELCATPLEVEAVADVLERQFGQPVEGTVLEATTTAVAGMVAAGVLEPAP